MPPSGYFDDDSVLRPPVPVHLRPLRELVNQVTVGLLPPEIRRQ